MVDSFLRGFYIGHLRREFEPDEADRRAEDLRELQAHILDSDEGLEGFLREVALLTNLDAQTRDRNAGGDCVTLSTVHQAKGMEWPAVIVPWLVEGLFPSKRSIDDGNIDEERRLFYVAVTRAKDRLYLIQPRARATPEGGLCPCETSRFLREIPPGLVTDKEWNQPPEDGYKCSGSPLGSPHFNIRIRLSRMPGRKGSHGFHIEQICADFSCVKVCYQN